MKAKTMRNRFRIVAATSFCAIGTVIAAGTDSNEQGGDKFARLNNDAVRTVEVVAQLSDDAIAKLGKKDGSSNTTLKGSIRANGFLSAGKKEVRNQASPDEIAKIDAIKSRKGLHASVKGLEFAPKGSIKRTHMRIDDADTKNGVSRIQEIPKNFVKTKEQF